MSSLVLLTAAKYVIRGRHKAVTLSCTSEIFIGGFWGGKSFSACSPRPSAAALQHDCFQINTLRQRKSSERSLTLVQPPSACHNPVICLHHRVCVGVRSRNPFRSAARRCYCVLGKSISMSACGVNVKNVGRTRCSHRNEPSHILVPQTRLRVAE
jgi:hypothetical protein